MQQTETPVVTSADGAAATAAPAQPVPWDTADLRLARWGCRLVHREGEGWTVELPEDGAGDAAARVRRFDGEGGIVPAGAFDLVAAFARGAVLRPHPEVEVLEDVGPAEVELEPVDRRSTAAAVVRRAIAAATLRLIAHDPWVRLGGDPEAVHQARVAVRRLRSDLRTFGPLLVSAWSDPLREELRWLGGELGRVRDAEVLAGEIAAAVDRLPAIDRGAGRRLVADFEAEIAAGREQLLEAMRTTRYLALLDRLVEAASNPMLTPAAEETASDVLPRLVGKPWRRLRRDARRLRGGATDEELHALRIRAKRARYAAEAGAPVLGGGARRFAKAVAGLQDVLGAHHDAVVAGERLRARGGSRPLAFVAGQAWAVERVTSEETRASWPRAWRRARRRKLRRWMSTGS